MEVDEEQKDILRKRLLQACKEGYADVVRNLAPFISVAEPITTSDRTPLHVAATKGWFEVVRSLVPLLSKEQLNRPDSSGWNAFVLACWHGFYALANELLDNGADINNLADRHEGPNIMHSAAFSNHRFVFDWLERLRAHPRFSRLVNGVDEFERCSLWICCKLGHLEIANKLVNYGANVTVRDREGWTLLHAAIISGKTECLRWVLDLPRQRFAYFGDYVNFPDYNGNTPLHLACVVGRSDFAKILLDEGADPDIYNLVGESPLSRALLDGQWGIIRDLLDLGLDPYTANHLFTQAPCLPDLVQFPHIVHEYYAELERLLNQVLIADLVSIVMDHVHPPDYTPRFNRMGTHLQSKC